MMKFPIYMESHNPFHGSSHHQPAIDSNHQQKPTGEIGMEPPCRRHMSYWDPTIMGYPAWETNSLRTGKSPFLMGKSTISWMVTVW